MKPLQTATQRITRDQKSSLEFSTQAKYKSEELHVTKTLVRAFGRDGSIYTSYIISKGRRYKNASVNLKQSAIHTTLKSLC